jgi:glycosyltransferase involved in cell wall biosynthesis
MSDSDEFGRMNGRMVALLGRRDEPTDAVEEYCRYLSAALDRRGEIAMEIERVKWAEAGWPAALRELRVRAEAWKGEWVLSQYTALAWSERGFPLRFLRVLNVLRDAGVRMAVVFHDVEPYGGMRIVDRMRRASQLRTMRQVLGGAELGIFTVALQTIRWLGRAPAHARFIPVGANLRPGPDASSMRSELDESLPRVAVFGITGGEPGKRESELIAKAVRVAAVEVGRIFLHAFGRGAAEREGELREGLRGVPVDVRVDGVLPAERVAEALGAAAVMLFVREPISTRRGSAIAGISCGLPVICYGGEQTAAPITDAGVVLVSKERSEELGEALIRVLSDREYRTELANRSRAAYREHFSWDAVAARYVEVFNERG